MTESLSTDNESPESPPDDGKGARRGRRMWIWLLLGLLAIWLISDWGYSSYVQYRIRRWEQTFSRNSDGVREGCEAFEMGEAQSPQAILMVHGLNDSPACFRVIAPQLAERGYFCKAIRLKGFAEPTPKYAEGTREQWLKQIGAALAELRDAHPRVYIVAHSLGGALSMNYLMEHPEAADRIVLLAPGIDVSNARSPLLSARRWHTVSNGLLQMTRVTASPFGIDAAKVTDEDYPYRTPFTPRSIFDESFETIDSLRGREEDFITPVLLAGSHKDVVIDWETAERYIRNSGSPHVEVEYYDDSGHAFLVDHTADELAQRIDQFLQSNAGE